MHARGPTRRPGRFGVGPEGSEVRDGVEGLGVRLKLGEHAREVPADAEGEVPEGERGNDAHGRFGH